jgi:hypothetical protein
MGEQTAERIKIEIGSASALKEELGMEVRGRDTVSHMPRRTTITSEEVREALSEPLGSIIDAVKRTLERADWRSANRGPAGGDEHDAAVGEVLVDPVQLRAAFRAERVRERQEASPAARALADARRVEGTGVALDDREGERAERLRVAAHDLDREVARKLEDRIGTAHAGNSVENSRCVALKAA